jgi:hypothetical protein
MPQEEQPLDLAKVRYAFRLGWAVAELRGRYRPDRYGQRDPGHPPVFTRNGYGLPLANERSPAEIRKELVDTVEDLSGAIELNDERSKTLWTALKIGLEDLEKENAQRATEWPNVARKFYELDAHTQDTLVLDASQATAYQLGRGLAETFWALQPDCADHEMGSWRFVLGSERCETLRRLAARLSAYINKEVVAAIDGPLESWSRLAAEPAARAADDVEIKLYRQALLWRDLIRGERSPADLQMTRSDTVPSSAQVWSDLKLYQKAAGSLKWPLVAGAFSIALLVAGAALLAAGEGKTALTTVVGILGAIGLTSAGLYGRAKAQITSLFSSLSQAVRIERIRQTADLCPAVGSPTLTHRPVPSLSPPAAYEAPAASVSGSSGGVDAHAESSGGRRVESRSDV